MPLDTMDNEHGADHGGSNEHLWLARTIQTAN